MRKQINDCKKRNLAAQDKKKGIVERIHLHIKMGRAISNKSKNSSSWNCIFRRYERKRGANK
jgi:hypothetical protein